MKRIFTLLTFSLILGSTSPSIAADAGPVTHDLFKHDDIQIEVLSQGKGPTIVMLPSPADPEKTIKPRLRSLLCKDFG